jgi:uncharacterized protein (TIGR02598 family)
MRADHFRVRAFSLLEVVVALTVVSFSLIGILGLLPVALNTAKDSQDETRVTQMAQELMEDLKGRKGIQFSPQTFDTNVFPLLPVEIAYSRQGRVVEQADPQAYYKLKLEITTHSSLPSGIYELSGLYSWPYHAPLRVGSQSQINQLVRP